MDNIVYELKEKNELIDALKTVAINFKESEINHYSPLDLQKAYDSLLGYDIFNECELHKLVKKGTVKVFGVYQGSALKAVSALVVEDGKILFLSADKTEAGQEGARQILEKMVEERENAPDHRLNLLAFIGQERDLVRLGFIRINPSVFLFFDIKFIAMRYDYAQIDIER